MDYDDILNRTAKDIPKAKTLPDGTYGLAVRNAQFVAPKGDGNDGKILFFYVVTEAHDDVNQADLDELGDDYDLTTNEVVKTFWVGRNKDMDPVIRMLDVLGTDEDKTILDRLRDAKGRQVLAYLTTRTYQQDGVTKEENTIRDYGQIE